MGRTRSAVRGDAEGKGEGRWWSWLRSAAGRRAGGAVVVVAGAILVAVGVGLAPHLVKVGVSVSSALALVLLLGGLAAVVGGGRAALRGRHVAAKVAGGFGTAVAVVAAIAVVAPAVAATHVPATQVTTTPAAEGVEHEEVTVTTADGVDLAAWYLEGDGRAGVVVAHGAGSTRSEVIGQAAALARAGYSVLLLDARGHGDSGGTAMDFGWYGDLDIAAGTAFLAARPELDPGRIGVVGFSMGGEEAIGASAADPRIRAVVAEGATARRSADEEWLSDVYGWRGRVQEGVETLQDGVTDALTGASPPTPLREAVVTASDVRFLLITAGEVEDEAHAAAHIAAGASDRVEVWTVEGVGHTGGWAAEPDEWTRRVVGFLDRALA